MRRLRLIAPLITGLVLGGVLGWALWGNGVRGLNFWSRTGLLELQVDTAHSIWTRTTPGYTTELCGPMLFGADDGEAGDAVISACDVNPTTVVTMPGDSFQYVVPISVSARGQNLAANLELEFGGDAAALAVTYYLSDPDTGILVFPASGTPAPWGTPIELSILGTDGGSTNDWNLVVDVAVLGEYQWASDFTDQEYAGGGSWSTDAVRAKLGQHPRWFR